MSKGRRSKRGYSMIEAIVSVTLVAVGIVSIISAYSSLSRDQRISIESEKMQRLALDKYDELVATESLQTQTLNGDFSDRGEDNFLWDASVQPSGTTNVSSLTVAVQPRNGSDTEKTSVSGVVYQPPQTITTTGGGTP